MPSRYLLPMDRVNFVYKPLFELEAAEGSMNYHELLYLIC